VADCTNRHNSIPIDIIIYQSVYKCPFAHVPGSCVSAEEKRGTLLEIGSLRRLRVYVILLQLLETLLGALNAAMAVFVLTDDSRIVANADLPSA